MPISDNDIKSALEAETMAQAAEGEQFQAGRVITISSGHAVHDTYTAFLPPLLPLFIATLSLSKTEAGLLSVFTQAPSLIQPVIGHMADRTSRHSLFFLAPALTAALMSLLGMVSSYAMLALLLTLVGISSAAFHAVAPAIAGKLSGGSLGRGMSFWMVGGELGRALGPIIVVSALRIMTLEKLPWMMVLGLAFSFILFIRLKDVHTHTHHVTRGLPLKPALRRMRPVVMPLVGYILFRSFMMAALMIYLPTFLTEEGTDLWLAGASLSVLEVAGIVGALLGGSVSDRLGRRIVLLIFTLLTPIFMFVLLASKGWVQFPILLVLGLGLLSTTPVIMALVQESFPENRALANGIYMSLSFVIRSGGVVLLGVMGDFVGLRQAFTASAFVMFLSVPFIFMLPNGRKNEFN